jgi:hypothetical protein
MTESNPLFQIFAQDFNNQRKPPIRPESTDKIIEWFRPCLSWLSNKRGHCFFLTNGPSSLILTSASPIAYEAIATAQHYPLKSPYEWLFI